MNDGTNKGDRIVGRVSVLGLIVLLAWSNVSERDRRVKAEQQLLHMARAIDQRCTRQPSARLITTINAEQDGQYARWCGHIRTTIETPRIEWERAR